MDQYKKLYSQYEKLKKKYIESAYSLKDETIKSLINDLEGSFQFLKEATINTDEKKVLELTFRIKIFLGGLKLLLRKSKNKS